MLLFRLYPEAPLIFDSLYFSASAMVFCLRQPYSFNKEHVKLRVFSSGNSARGKLRKGIKYSQ